MKKLHVPSMGYLSQRLHFGALPLDELAARHGTPLYVYNFDVVRQRVDELKKGLGNRDHLICYAVKANTSSALLRMLSSMGLGADVVSIGELYCARKAGIDADKIVFSGVAKTLDEISYAVKEDILSFNVESPGEITKIRTTAKSQNKRVRISLRINPDIDAKTHPKIATGLHATKFGLETTAAVQIAKDLLKDPNLDLCGISCHIGSQILDLSPLKEAAVLVLDFAKELRAIGHKIDNIDLGGGVGVAYDPREKSPSLAHYGSMLSEVMVSKGDSSRLILEPGRALVSEAGVLLTRVIEVKTTGDRNFVMVDAGMNDLVRPAMYDAYHHIVPLWDTSTSEITADIVGPVCETGDYFALDRRIPKIKEGDTVAILHAGAYGFSMASHYNLRPKPAEIAIEADNATIIRKRETIEELIS